MAVVTYYSHDLGSTLLPNGDTLKCTLYCEVSSLTIPENILATVLVDSIREGYSVKDTGSELMNGEIRLIEDYTEYSEGFWFKVLTAGKVEWFLTIDEVDVANDAFLGHLAAMPNYIEAEEQSIGEPGYIRRVLRVPVRDSFADRFEQVTAQEIFNEFQTSAAYYNEYTRSPPTFTYRVVPLPGVFAVMLYLAYGQTYDVGDLVMLNEGLQYYDGTAAVYRSFDDLSMVYAIDSGGWTPNNLMYTWVNNGFNGFDILRNVLSQHNMFCRHEYYGGEHKIAVFYKGYSLAMSGYLTEPTPYSSVWFIPRSPESVANLNIESQAGSHFGYIQGVAFSGNGVPLNTDFEVNLALDWHGNGFYNFLCFDTGSTFNIITDIQTYDPITTSYVGPNDPYIGLANAIQACYGSFPARSGWGRWTTFGYERSYRTIKFSDGTDTSTKHLRPGPGSFFGGSDCWVQINNGATTKDYMAISVDKNLVDDEMTVAWFEVPPGTT